MRAENRNRKAHPSLLRVNSSFFANIVLNLIQNSVCIFAPSTAASHLPVEHAFIQNSERVWKAQLV